VALQAGPVIRHILHREFVVHGQVAHKRLVRLPKPDHGILGRIRKRLELATLFQSLSSMHENGLAYRGKDAVMKVSQAVARFP
jgi:hypothetical protein